MIRQLLLFITITLTTGLVSAQDINDEEIGDRVTRAIANNEELTGSDIYVFSVNGYVLLAGQVLTPQQRQEASVAAAFATNDIRRLINELQVVEELEYSYQESDLAILKEIEAVIPDMSPATLPVIHDGIVHLLGRVTREEGNEVANTISKMSGVKNIRLSYEFVD